MEAARRPCLVLLGQEKGYFEAEKLDITIDQGEGSAATVSRLMSGAYDAGFGDMNAIIQNAAIRPGDTPVMVYMLYSRAPFALLTKAPSPIKSVEDLAGKKLGTPPGGARSSCCRCSPRKTTSTTRQSTSVKSRPICRNRC